MGGLRLLLLCVLALGSELTSAASVPDNLAGDAFSDLLRLRSVEECALADSEPLKVYVHDLPQKFHFGLFQRVNPDDLPHRPEKRPRFPYRRGQDGVIRTTGEEHSPESYLAYDLLYPPQVNSTTTVGNDVIVVEQPEKADFFFVPFLGSYSFDIFSKEGMHSELMQKDKRLQEELMEILKASKWWQRSGGHDHIVGMMHPNALRYVRKQLATALLLVADFGRSPPSISRLSKDVVIPYSHMVPAFEESPADEDKSWQQRTTMLYFQGTVKRKNEGYIRALLFKMLHDDPDVHFANNKGDAEGVLLATAGMRSSRFCFHVAGDTPSSCRLFDAIVSHCVPVVISNKLELPYEATLDYSQFSIFLSHEDALKEGHILSLLRNMTKAEWAKRWRKLLEVSHHFEFQIPSIRGDGASMVWRDIRQRLPMVRQALHKYQRTRLLEDSLVQ